MYVQETDSRSSGFTLRYEDPFIRDSYARGLDYEDTTIGDVYIRQSAPFVHDLVAPALKAVWQIETEEIKNLATTILWHIQQTIRLLQKTQVDLSYLPKLRSFNVDDGSILIEWIFHEFRFGFSVEQDPQESSWYLVTSPDKGSITASGYILGSDVGHLVSWLIYFAVLHV